MTVELKKGYIIDSFYDKNTRSYVTTLRDNEGNQIRDAYYSGNMTDRDADVQFIKEFFYKYMYPEDKTNEYEEPEEVVEVEEDEIVEEYLESKIAETKRKTKKAKLPALSTLSPIMPDGAAGIATFNSGVGLSEEYLDRDELIYRIGKMGFRYKYDKYTDEQLYKIYQERLKTLEKRRKQKEEKQKKQRTIDRMIDKLEQVDYDEDSDTYSDGNYYKDGIEFESEEAAREYFGESMDRGYHWDVDTIIRIIKQAWEDAGLILREDKIDISRHDNWCIVEIKYIDDWEFKHINKPMIRKALKKELDLYNVKQSSWKEDGWGNSDYGKTLRYDLYMYPPEEQEMNESMENKLYLSDMHEAWDIDESYNYELYDLLCSEYSSLYPYDITLSQVYDEIMNNYNDEDLANDVIEYLESYEEENFYESKGNTYKKVLNENLRVKRNSVKHNFKTINEGLKHFERKAFNESSKTYDFEALYESVKNNLDANDIKKLSKFLNKADSAEDVATYIKGLLTEDLDNRLMDIAQEIENAVQDEGVWCGIYAISPYSIAFLVEGDWKWGHLRFEHIAGAILQSHGLNYESFEDEVGDSDTDDYEAIHTFNIDKSPMEESLNESACTRLADTDEQEKSIKKIESIAKKLGIKLSPGTKVGKYPQSVILDKGYQDNFVRVTANGSFKINGTAFGDWKDDYFDIDDIPISDIKAAFSLNESLHSTLVLTKII